MILVTCPGWLLVVTAVYASLNLVGFGLPAHP